MEEPVHACSPYAVTTMCPIPTSGAGYRLLRSCRDCGWFRWEAER